MELLHFFRLAANACGTRTGFLPSLYDSGPGFSCDGNGNITITNLQGMLTVVANVSRILIAAAGGIAVIVIIVASIYYITAFGDAGRIKRAKDILINTVVGLVIILSAYAVVTWVAKGF